MSDTDSISEDIEGRPPVPEGADVVLGILYRAATSSGSLPLMLLVGGTWITGNAVSGREFFDRLSAQNSAGDDEGNAFALIGRRVYPTADDVAAGLAEELPPDDRTLTFIHLVDACSMSTSGPIPTNQQGLFRVRISAVDAWSVGSLGIGVTT